MKVISTKAKDIKNPNIAHIRTKKNVHYRAYLNPKLQKHQQHDKDVNGCQANPHLAQTIEESVSTTFNDIGS